MRVGASLSSLACDIYSKLYLAGEDVTKGREGVVQGFVVNGLVKILDEHVAHSGLPEGGVSLGPHDSDRLPFHHVEVHGVQGSLGWTEEGAERQRERSGVTVYMEP